MHSWWCTCINVVLHCTVGGVRVSVLFFTVQLVVYVYQCCSSLYSWWCTCISIVLPCTVGGTRISVLYFTVQLLMYVHCTIGGVHVSVLYLSIQLVVYKSTVQLVVYVQQCCTSLYSWWCTYISVVRSLFSWWCTCMSVVLQCTVGGVRVSVLYFTVQLVVYVYQCCVAGLIPAGVYVFTGCLHIH